MYERRLGLWQAWAQGVTTSSRQYRQGERACGCYWRTYMYILLKPSVYSFDNIQKTRANESNVLIESSSPRQGRKRLFGPSRSTKYTSITPWKSRELGAITVVMTSSWIYSACNCVWSHCWKLQYTHGVTLGMACCMQLYIWMLSWHA